MGSVETDHLIFRVNEFERRINMKTYTTPELSVIDIMQNDILTLSPADEGTGGDWEWDA